MKIFEIVFVSKFVEISIRMNSKHSPRVPGTPGPLIVVVYLFYLQLEHNNDNEASRTFVFENEGHTLGNVLKSIICR